MPRTKDASGREIKLAARGEAYKGSDDGPPLPPLTDRHMVDLLMEVGPTEPGAAGPVPITWTTIRHWRIETFAHLSAWQVRMLRRLSIAYLGELHAAEDHTRPAPWWPTGAQIDRGSEEDRLRAVLG